MEFCAGLHFSHHKHKPKDYNKEAYFDIYSYPHALVLYSLWIDCFPICNYWFFSNKVCIRLCRVSSCHVTLKDETCWLHLSCFWDSSCFKCAFLLSKEISLFFSTEFFWLGSLNTYCQFKFEQFLLIYDHSGIFL